jgi:hypothetical protein
VLRRTDGEKRVTSSRRDVGQPDHVVYRHTASATRKKLPPMMPRTSSSE